MKLFSRFIILFAGCLCLYSCSGRSNADEIVTEEGFDFSSPINQKVNVFSDGKYEYAEYGSAFEPDYRPGVPEKEPVAKKLSTVFARAKNSRIELSDAVRELSKYAVKYNEKRISIKELANPESTEESSYWEENWKTRIPLFRKRMLSNLKKKKRQKLSFFMQPSAVK